MFLSLQSLRLLLKMKVKKPFLEIKEAVKEKKPRYFKCKTNGIIIREDLLDLYKSQTGHTDFEPFFEKLDTEVNLIEKNNHSS